MALITEKKILNFVKKATSESGLLLKEYENILAVFEAFVYAELRKGNQVKIFGMIFKKQTRLGGKKWRNPITNEIITIKDKDYIKVTQTQRSKDLIQK